MNSDSHDRDFSDIPTDYASQPTPNPSLHPSQLARGDLEGFRVRIMSVSVVDLQGRSSLMPSPSDCLAGSLNVLCVLA